jgi:hypothetical protein
LDVFNFTFALVRYGAVGNDVWRCGRDFGRSRNPSKITAKFVAEMAFFGFVLTFAYDILSSVGFYSAYFSYPTVWDSTYMTLVPAYLPYPP